MKRFIYTVRETLARSGIVLANNEHEAREIIDDARSECEIVLDAEDFIDYDIEIEPDDGKHDYLDVWEPDNDDDWDEDDEYEEDSDE